MVERCQEISYANEPMKLQIVIPVMNLWRRYTAPCIDSIRSSIDTRIMVIDNASSDETGAEATARVSKNFIYRRNATNLGTARAWNDGVRDAFENGRDMVLILNNDVLLHRECVDRLVGRLTRDNDGLAIVTAMDVRAECAEPSDVFRQESRAKETLSDADSPNFSAFLLNRACWETVGPFDESFFPAYFEDNDYHYRVRLAGLRAITHPPAIFYHFASRTQCEALARPVVGNTQFQMNSRYYTRKWGGPPGKELYQRPFGP